LAFFPTYPLSPHLLCNHYCFIDHLTIYELGPIYHMRNELISLYLLPGGDAPIKPDTPLTYFASSYTPWGSHLKPFMGMMYPPQADNLFWLEGCLVEMGAITLGSSFLLDFDSPRIIQKL
ncbi:MAG: hypothetical protein N3D15_02825, partial [Syntrophorhabdaceae bacterium]|nr:hypothetical protein [Syntrophorhabdaceae bacterium]